MKRYKPMPPNYFNLIDASTPKLYRGIKLAQKDPSKYDYVRTFFINHFKSTFRKLLFEAEEVTDVLLNLENVTYKEVQIAIMQSFIEEEGSFILKYKRKEKKQRELV